MAPSVCSPNPVSAPGPAALRALAKTAAQEWPTAQVKAIDIAVGQQSPITVAENLAQEILAGGAELEVGLGSTHGRVTVVADARQVTTRRRRIDHRDVIVVSGGGRGVTAASVIALAKETQASFVLIGRTELGDEPAEAHGLTTDAELKRALLTSCRGARPQAHAQSSWNNRCSASWPTVRCVPPSPR